MSDDYTPTDEDMRTAWIQSHQEQTWGGQSDIGGRPKERIAEWYRWLAAHDAALRAEWDAERPEQGETEGRREYAAAYSARNGNVIALGAETVVQDDAEAVRAEFEREDPDGPTYFVASRILPPWLPVPDTTERSE